MKGSLALLVKGFCMGAADVVPGVSGGTVALILGIYQQLIDAIKSFDLGWFRSFFRLDFKTMVERPLFAFLIPLGLGIFAALLFFTRVVPLPVLIKTHPEQVYGLFFGLISGSIVILLIEIQRTGLKDIILLMLGTIAGLYLFNLVPAATPNTPVFIFFSGAVAICAMILPGISGSFILLMLKKYAYVLNGIGHFDFAIIIPFGLGVVTGLMLFSRVLSWLLSRFYKQTLLFIIGLLVASLWVIWPFQERTYTSVRGKEYLVETTPFMPESVSGEVIHALLLCTAGIIVVVFINWFVEREKA